MPTSESNLEVNRVRETRIKFLIFIIDRSIRIEEKIAPDLDLNLYPSRYLDNALPNELSHFTTIK